MYSWPFRRKVRLIWWLLCTLVLVSVPYTFWEYKENGYSIKYAGWTLSGVLVLLTIPITVYQIALHVKHYNVPELQRNVVRIICMVPIYALVSWLSLRFITARHWLSPLRECYEAVALYSFLCYLIESLRIKTGNYEGWLEALPPQEPVWPLRGVIGRLFGVHTIERGADFMSAMRRGVLTFVVVRPSLAGVQMICMLTHRWGEDQFTLEKGWLWCMLINNVAQFYAIYCLFALYRATATELADIRPLRKFLLIKAVVFFTFWQGFILSILSHLGLIGKNSFTTYQTNALATSFQDALICLECLPAAIIFAHIFPVREYMRPGEFPGTIWDNVVDMFDARDIGRDVGDLVDHQVNYGRDLAVQGVSDAAVAVHDVVAVPADMLTRPVRQLQEYWIGNDTPRSSVSKSSRDGGHAMQPLLSSFQQPRGGQAVTGSQGQHART